jgi:hypothetical protein
MLILYNEYVKEGTHKSILISGKIHSHLSDSIR